MRDPDRIEPMLDLLREVWMQAPDLRLGQIVVNAVRPGEPVPAVFYMDDDKMAEGLRALADVLAKNSGPQPDEPT